MVVIEFIICSSSFIAYHLYKEYKIKKQHKQLCEERLTTELNHDLKMLNQLPKGNYITLSGDEQKLVDNAQEIINLGVEKYNLGSLDHLYKYIPLGSRRNELRAKQRRIEHLLEEISFSQ